ncbi:MAG: DUF3631 domain-containing protein [Gammaproteobacteria bacterium]|nr:DUF3631 domain-containing protein [Gammaproteobacteria bacterium]MDP2346379.1 DUF3631 domain-containing protein [Gammaproteobacteria bacterium]
MSIEQLETIATIEPPKIAPETPASESEVFARLAKLRPIDYDRVRKEEAKALGIQVSTLDDAVKGVRNDGNTAPLLPFAEVEPSEDPVEPAELLNELVATIRRYLIIDEEYADAFALWVALTWFIDVVEVAPLLIITAPEKACGKTHALTICGYVVARPLSAANSTSSFLFRAIDMWNPTLLIDEADTFIRHNDDLKGLVNAGHTRASAFVGRTVAVGDTHEPRLFPVWGAKAFAGISLEKHLPDATMSRGIIINLRRKLPHESVERLRHADKAVFQALTAKLARFAEDYASQVRSANPTLPEELSDRDQDNWEPLLAIASCAGEEWGQRATRAALKIYRTANSNVSTGSELLADIQEVFELKKCSKISTVDLITALVADEEKCWATYNRGRPLTPRQLAKQLSAYDIHPKTVRMPYGTPKGYDTYQFADAFSRYLQPGPPEM